MQNIDNKIKQYENAKIRYESKIKELDNKLAVLENEAKQLETQMVEVFSTTEIEVAEKKLNDMTTEIEKLEAEFKETK